MMDEKMQANQNMQPKKKHKKSGMSHKMKEKVEVRAALPREGEERGLSAGRRNNVCSSRSPSCRPW